MSNRIKIIRREAVPGVEFPPRVDPKPIARPPGDDYMDPGCRTWTPSCQLINGPPMKTRQAPDAIFSGPSICAKSVPRI